VGQEGEALGAAAAAQLLAQGGGGWKVLIEVPRDDGVIIAWLGAASVEACRYGSMVGLVTGRMAGGRQAVPPGKPSQLATATAAISLDRPGRREGWLSQPHQSSPTSRWQAKRRETRRMCLARPSAPPLLLLLLPNASLNTHANRKRRKMALETQHRWKDVPSACAGGEQAGGQRHCLLCGRLRRQAVCSIPAILSYKMHSNKASSLPSRASKQCSPQAWCHCGTRRD
jgi:hypothetical protein